MKRQVIYVLLILLMIMQLGGCDVSPEKKYKRLEKEELSKGIRYDSLFMGLHFQMSEKEFRDHCFDLHLAGKFMQGGQKSSVWVEYKLMDEMSYPAAINFYPIFQNDTITEMNASVYYDNVEYKDHVFEFDSLMIDVLNMLDKWYGGEHMKIPSPFFYKEDVYVIINGNRRITIYPDINGRMVNLWYVDLLAKEQK